MRAAEAERERVRALRGRECVFSREKEAAGLLSGVETHSRPRSGRRCVQEAGWVSGGMLSQRLSDWERGESSLSGERGFLRDRDVTSLEWEKRREILEDLGGRARRSEPARSAE